MHSKHEEYLQAVMSAERKTTAAAAAATCGDFRKKQGFKNELNIMQNKGKRNKGREVKNNLQF